MCFIPYSLGLLNTINYASLTSEPSGKHAQNSMTCKDAAVRQMFTVRQTIYKHTHKHTQLLSLGFPLHQVAVMVINDSLIRFFVINQFQSN